MNEVDLIEQAWQQRLIDTGRRFTVAGADEVHDFDVEGVRWQPGRHVVAIGSPDQCDCWLVDNETAQAPEALHAYLDLTDRRPLAAWFDERMTRIRVEWQQYWQST